MRVESLSWELWCFDNGGKGDRFGLVSLSLKE